MRAHRNGIGPCGDGLRRSAPAPRLLVCPSARQPHEGVGARRQRRVAGRTAPEQWQVRLAARCRDHSHAQLPVDCNWTENQIWPMPIDRNNWLFAGSLRAATVMNLIQPARMNEKDPDWLSRIETRDERVFDLAAVLADGTTEFIDTYDLEMTCARFAWPEPTPVALKMWAGHRVQRLPAGHRRLRASGALGDVGVERRAVRPC